ncbi:MAG: hypothetical protein K9W44_03615 [Candidatus Lokiarchaeota archaeon]|nr:hypothetical protein [Candidatus Harpocratesius repetitus]
MEGELNTEDSETILGWMKINERRFLKSTSRIFDSNDSNNVLKSDNESLSIQKINNSNLSKNQLLNPQTSLDRFIPSNMISSRQSNSMHINKQEKITSSLFDDQFSLSDFRQLTNQWKRKNSIAS